MSYRAGPSEVKKDYHQETLLLLRRGQGESRLHKQIMRTQAYTYGRLPYSVWEWLRLEGSIQYLMQEVDELFDPLQWLEYLSQHVVTSRHRDLSDPLAWFPIATRCSLHADVNFDGNDDPLVRVRPKGVAEEGRFTFSRFLRELAWHDLTPYAKHQVSARTQPGVLGPEQLRQLDHRLTAVTSPVLVPPRKACFGLLRYRVRQPGEWWARYFHFHWRLELSAPKHPDQGPVPVQWDVWADSDEDLLAALRQLPWTWGQGIRYVTRAKPAPEELECQRAFLEAFQAMGAGNHD